MYRTASGLICHVNLSPVSRYRSTSTPCWVPGTGGVELGRLASAVLAAELMYKRTLAACETVTCNNAAVFAMFTVPFAVDPLARVVVVNVAMAAFGDVLLIAARRATTPMP